MVRIPDASKLGYLPSPHPRKEPAPVEVYDAEKWRQRAEADAARKRYFADQAFKQRLKQSIAAKRDADQRRWIEEYLKQQGLGARY